MEDLQYPLGRYEPRILDPPGRALLIRQIETLPEVLLAAVGGLRMEQLDTPYRPGGWTVRRVVHHLADSHMQAFGRFKLALTEDAPRVKAYDEKKWAETADVLGADTGHSIHILAGLHSRLSALLRSLGEKDFTRTINHPERGVMSLDDLLGLYAWHGRHHAAQITSLRERMGW
ncbi:MAG: putative metal-dependent hydrolase [Bacteroidota bacterium]